MRSLVVLGLAVLVGWSGPGPAWAKRRAPEFAPRPVELEAAANAALTAHRDGRRAALARLAGWDHPDVWRVADVLRARGAADAAEALARQAPLSDREALLAWVARGPQSSDVALAELTARLKRSKQDGGSPAEAWRAVQQAESLLGAESFRAIDAHLCGAEALVAQRRLSEAAVEFDAVARRARELGCTGLETSALGQAMATYRRLGREDLVGERLETLLALQRTREDPHRLGMALGARGQWCRRQGRYGEAARLHEEELHLRLGYKAPHDVVRVAADLGLCLHQAGRHPRALLFLEFALQRMEARGDRDQTAWLLRAIGRARSELSDWDGALADLRVALRLREEQRNWKHAGRCLNTIGGVHVSRGAFAQAIPYFEQAVAHGERARFAQGVTEALTNLSGTYVKLDNFPRAIRCLDRVLAVSEATGGVREAADGLSLKGTVHRLAGEHEASLASFERALPLYERVGARWDHALTALEIAGALVQLEDYARARPAVDRARALAVAIRAQRSLFHIETLEAELLAEVGDLDASLRVLRRAHALALEVGDLNCIATADLALLETYPAPPAPAGGVGRRLGNSSRRSGSLRQASTRSTGRASTSASRTRTTSPRMRPAASAIPRPSPSFSRAAGPASSWTP